MYPEVAVLALSMYPEDQFAIRMIKAGARGYLHKDSAPEILEEAMRTVVEGKQYISAELTRLMIEELAKGGQPLIAKAVATKVELLQAA